MLPRLIPLVLVEKNRAVHTVRFGRGNYLGDPLNISRLYSGLGADELMVLDRSRSARQTLLATGGLKRIASEVSIPIAYGGGIQAQSDVARAFKAGADKIVVRSDRPNSESIVAWASSEYGSQAVVACINFRPKQHFLGKRYPSTVGEVVAQAIFLSDLGAGEILVQSVLKAGTRSGLDALSMVEVKKSVSRPIVLSGGASSLSEVASAFKQGFSGVAIATLFSLDPRSNTPFVSYVSDEDKARFGWL